MAIVDTSQSPLKATSAFPPTMWTALENCLAVPEATDLSAASGVPFTAMPNLFSAPVPLPASTVKR